MILAELVLLANIAQGDTARAQNILSSNRNFTFRGVVFGIPYKGPMNGLACEKNPEEISEKICTFRDYHFYGYAAVAEIRFHNTVLYQFDLSTNIYMLHKNS